MTAPVSSYDALKSAILAEAAAALGVDGAEGLRLSDPPSPEHGDLSIACHPLAGRLKKKPDEIAAQVAEGLQQSTLVDTPTATQGFCNVRVRRDVLLDVVTSQVETEGAGFGQSAGGPREKWLIEYSGPNTNKPLHIGHLRNTILGASLANIVHLFGHDTTRYNIINDRGIHICKSMVAYDRFGEGQTPASTGEKGDQLVGRFYSLFASKAAEEFKQWTESEGSAALERYLAENRAVVETAADLQLRKRFLGEQDAKSLPFKPRKVKPAKYPELMQKDGRLESAYQSWHESQSALQQELVETEALRRLQAAQARQFEAEVSELHAQARDFLRRWEEKDTEVRELWQTMNGWVLAGLDATYERLGVVFDEVDFESDTYLLGKDIVARLLEKDIARRRDDGAIVFDMPSSSAKEPPQEKVILRADGTSVYITQDLGTLMRRFERHDPDHLIYVVGSEQELHFQTLFTLVDRDVAGLGDRCEHLSYGMVELPHGKMKSREGDIVEADGFLDDIKAAALEQIRSRSPDLADDVVDERAEVIALAAVKYQMLKFNKRSTVKFDVEAALDLNGKTGTYCLYALARIRSILRKLVEADAMPQADEPLDAAGLAEEEAALLLGVLRFPEAVEMAVRDREPYHVAEFVFRLARSFNSYYTATDPDGGVRFPVVQCPDAALRGLRTRLIQLVAAALEGGLESLGIRTLDEM